MRARAAVCQHAAALRAQNIAASALARGLIPKALDPVQGVWGAPKGAYRAAGITDDHLHLNGASVPDDAERTPAQVP